MNDQTNEIMEICGEIKKVRICGTIYKIATCPLRDLPKLQDLLAKLQKISDDKMLADSSRNLMVDIMYMGLVSEQPDITKNDIEAKFSLSVFPTIVRIMLDLNDFLSGMGEMGMVANQLMDLSQARSGRTLVQNTFPKKGNSKNSRKKN